MEELVEAISQLKEKEALSLVKKRIDKDEDPLLIIGDLGKGMEEIGNLFEQGDYFLPEVIVAGEIFKDCMKIIEPKLISSKKAEPTGKVVIGTVQGDVHEIGKNIVATLLKGAGFEVDDLGADVSPERFIEKIKDKKPHILGLSCLLTLAFGSMKRIIREVEAAGLREGLTIIVGGGAVDAKVKDFVGADACGKDANEAVKICKQLVVK